MDLMPHGRPPLTVSAELKPGFTRFHSNRRPNSCCITHKKTHTETPTHESPSHTIQRAGCVVLVVLFTSVMIPESVFKLTVVPYNCVLGCGGTLYGDHGSFSSPNYPATYPNSSHCEWGIEAPRGRVVTITFAQISIDDTGDCQDNFLKLYDGPDATSPPAGPFCGVVGNPTKAKPN